MRKIIRILWIIGALACLQVSASAELLPIRALNTPCEAFLVAKENTTLGRPVTTSLKIDDIRAWLETQPEIDADQDALWLVGAPVRSSRRKALVAEVQKHLVEMGYPNLEVRTVQRITSFINEEAGVYTVAESGNQKLSSLDPNEIIKNLWAASPETLDHLVIVGTPVLGSARTNIEGLVQAILKDRGLVESSTVETEVRPMTIVKRFLTQPREALAQVADRIRYFFPIFSQDYQKPIPQELRTMGQKLLVPAIITVSVMVTQGQPMKIWLPVTLVNATNSGLWATFRTFLGNWFSRSQHTFPFKIMKNSIPTAFFTADIYWAGTGSLHDLAQIATLGAWLNFFSTKWITILFQTGWRAPVQSAVFSWERYRTLQGDSSNEMRANGSVIEKYVSYVMTQFYIYSIISHQTWFNLVHGPGGFALSKSQSPLAPGENLIMNFNAGNAAMVATALTATIFSWKLDWMNPVGALAKRLNDWESKFHGLYERAIAKVVGWLKKDSE